MDRRPLPVWLCLLIGAAAAGIGLAPWLVTGMRLPIQNLWDGDPGPAGMPRGLLPFSQYYLSLTAGLLMTGGALAGLFMQLSRARLHRWRVLAVVLGLALVQVVAIVQTAIVVRAGLQQSRTATLYFAAVLAAAGAAELLSLVVAGLIAARARPAVVIGMALAAVLVGPWVGGLVYPPGSVQTFDNLLGPLPFWIPPILIGAAIAWGGVRSIGRIAAAIGALMILWIGTAAITAVTSAAGTRVLARRPREMAEYATEVFRAALISPDLVIRQLLAAVIIAVAGLSIRRVIRMRGATDHVQR